MLTISQTMRSLENALDGGYLSAEEIHAAMHWCLELRGQEIGQALADRLNLWIARVERAEAETA